jgi:hypothetical protein
VFVVLAHERRRIVHFNVTDHPTAEQTAQQIVGAFPFDSGLPALSVRGKSGYYADTFSLKQ